mgnify:CR=1 FL=1
MLLPFRLAGEGNAGAPAWQGGSRAAADVLHSGVMPELPESTLRREWNAPDRYARDHGPIYRETRPGRFPVEPWATASNLAFLLVALYWGLRTRRRWRAHPMIAAALPLLLVGWTAGTLYHATRSHPVWLLLDWMPIAILLLLTGMTLWRRLTGWTGWAIALGLLPFFLSGILMRSRLALGWRITLNYALMGAALALPAALHCAVRYPRGWRWLAGAAASFAAALLFRQWDLSAPAFLPMGTHFLWHVFGSVAAFCICGYLVTDTERTPAAADAPRAKGALAGHRTPTTTGRSRMEHAMNESVNATRFAPPPETGSNP